MLFYLSSHKGNSISKFSEIFKENILVDLDFLTQHHTNPQTITYRKYDLFITCMSVCFLPKLPITPVAMFSEYLKRMNYLYRWLLKMKHPSELKLEIVHLKSMQDSDAPVP